MMRTDGVSKYPGITMAISTRDTFPLAMGSPMRFSSHSDTNKRQYILICAVRLHIFPYK